MSSTQYPFSFGSFDYFCSQLSLTLCPLVSTNTLGGGVEASCYSRNIQLGGDPGILIFEPAVLIIHLVALIMTGIMIYHIRSKYTAVGRKEIVMFFYMYAFTTIFEFLLVSGIIASSSFLYQYFVAGYIGLGVATMFCLLCNGFVGFQWAEDGTPQSLWSIRIATFVVFAITMFVALATFLGIGPFNSASPIGLFIVYFVFSVACVFIYYVLQIILVVKTLEDKWPIGDITVGFLFFAAGQVCQYIFSIQICNLAQHYIDGMFFGVICTLLGVMMVYKFWDSITKEDLEFSVTGKSSVWDGNGENDIY
ncbi:chitin synthase III catalytic subunit [Polychytrium aggregatum]|uniref:chitin synthase III catalytic subunit n=1 Tax=Polychytrium aggregatum TaxID=110093 RepID=UPI0022FEAE85|nr:chitin synthase III catalytic subunit [Polychytrium aggregatum]KAI9207876.1 chitin synthase III catalytic subunit [Polychytrium aggregatum]